MGAAMTAEYYCSNLSSARANVAVLMTLYKALWALPLLNGPSEV
jgi:hypothetical protein